MALNLKSIRQQAKTAIQGLYEGLCTITVKEKAKAEDKSIYFTDKVICVDKPCRLSHNSFTATTPQTELNTVGAEIKLFLDPDIDVPAGSTITVKQYGITDVYNLSSKPVVFETHQELTLELKEGKA